MDRSLDFEGLDGILAAALDEPVPPAPAQVSSRSELDLEGLDGILPPVPRTPARVRLSNPAAEVTRGRRASSIDLEGLDGILPRACASYAGSEQILQSALLESRPDTALPEHLRVDLGALAKVAPEPAAPEIVAPIPEIVVPILEPEAPMSEPEAPIPEIVAPPPAVPAPPPASVAPPAPRESSPAPAVAAFPDSVPPPPGPPPTQTSAAGTGWVVPSTRPTPLPIPAIQHPFMASQAEARRRLWAAGTAAALALAAGLYLSLARGPRSPSAEPVPQRLVQPVRSAPPAKRAEPPQPDLPTEPAPSPSVPPPAPARDRTVLVRFDFNGARPSAARLDRALSEVLPCDGRLQVTGHTCALGSEAANLRVGRLRAAAVAQRLRARGVPGDHITVTSAGSREPRFDNQTPEGRQRNRRVEVTCQAER